MTGPTGMECGGFGDDVTPKIPKRSPAVTRLLSQIDGDISFARPTSSSSIFDQQLGRTLRPSRGDAERAAAASPISLEDAQRLGFLPTVEIIPEAGTIGAGQYVRAAGADESLVDYGNFANLRPSGYMTVDEMAAKFALPPESLRRTLRRLTDDIDHTQVIGSIEPLGEIAPQQQSQQPQGEIN